MSAIALPIGITTTHRPRLHCRTFAASRAKPLPAQRLPARWSLSPSTLLASHPDTTTLSATNKTANRTRWNFMAPQALWNSGIVIRFDALVQGASCRSSTQRWSGRYKLTRLTSQVTRCWSTEVLNFEAMLTGGHPNSLGRTLEVVEAVLADRSRFKELYQCYFSSDEVVRLRVSNAVKRVTIEHPEWTMEFIDGLQSEVAAIDQASTQWTLALLFDLLRPQLSPAQRERALEIMKGNLAHHSDWIVLNNSMKVLGRWAKEDPKLARWLQPHAERLVHDERKSVASNARKLLKQVGGVEQRIRG